MKRIYNIFRKALIVAGMFSITSCDFLETEPYDFVSPTTFYRNESECTMALAGVYYTLSTESIYGNFYSTEMTNIDDLSFYTRNTNFSGKLWANDYSSSTKEVWDIWAKLYAGIKNANGLLENIDNAKMGEAVKNRIKGEAKFLRAYYHFMLVQAYYEVPIRKQSLDDINAASMGATPHAEALDWIIQEMEYCLSLVDNDLYDKSPSHVKKNTVYGILARVCLWRAGAITEGGKAFYEKAAKYANEVYTSDKHDLNPDVYAMWKNIASDKYDTKFNESMWEAEFIGTRTDNNYTDGRIGNTIGNSQRNGNADGSGYAYAFFSGSLVLWDLFEKNAGDKRRDLSMAPYYLNAKDLQVKWKDHEIAMRRCGKFRREWETAEIKNKNWTPENYPILRYADVLLMLAEAENEAKHQPTDLAYTALNLVRIRAGIPEVKDLSYEEFQQEVRDERARELCFESLRKFDLVRWGIYVDRMKNTLGAATADPRWNSQSAQEKKADKTGGKYDFAATVAAKTEVKHQFIPIPNKELSVNTKLKQNKWWK